MTDRIDTDATRGNIEQLRGCADADLGSHDVRWCLSVMDRLCDEVDRLRALADPAPVGLTGDERRWFRECQQDYEGLPAHGDLARALAIINRHVVDTLLALVESFDRRSALPNSERPDKIAGEAGIRKDRADTPEGSFAPGASVSPPPPPDSERPLPDGWTWRWCDCARSEYGPEPHPVVAPTPSPYPPVTPDSERPERGVGMTPVEKVQSAAAGGFGVSQLSDEFIAKHGPASDPDRPSG